MNDNLKADPGFFQNLSTADLHTMLAFLKTQLPKKCTKRNYQLNAKMVGWKKSQVITYDNLQENLQQVADKMRAHLQIARPIKIMVMDNLDAGKFETIGNLSCIFISADLYRQNYEQKLAILAHEMTHYYLMKKHQIVKPIVEENELLTEVGAVYIGFGFLLRAGYKTFKYESEHRTEIRKIGYIDRQLVEEAIIHTAYLRKQDPNWILENIPLPKKLFFYYRLFSLIGMYNKTRIDIGKNR